MFAEFHRFCPLVCLLTFFILSMNCEFGDSAAANRTKKHGTTKRPTTKSIDQVLPATKSTEKVLPPFIICRATKCDLRSHYCDDAISICASCADDCNPGRINGDQDAIDECREKCAWFYVFQGVSTYPPSTEETPTSTRYGTRQTDLPGSKGLSPASDRLTIIILLLSVVVLVSMLVVIGLLAAVFFLCKRLQSKHTLPPIKTNSAHLDQNAHCRYQDNIASLGLRHSDNKLSPSDGAHGSQKPETCLKTASDETQTSVQGVDDWRYSSTIVSTVGQDRGHCWNGTKTKDDCRRSKLQNQSSSMYPLLQSEASVSLPNPLPSTLQQQC